ncbi:unnamed protein product, partial [Effrenium voratum]
ATNSGSSRRAPRCWSGASASWSDSSRPQALEASRPLELRIQHLEQQIKVEEPSPEPRLAALERRLREAQEENARLARTFEERQSQLEGAVARVSGALPRMSVEIMSDWEALARERFAEAKVSQDLARLSQRLEAAPSASATERCLEELAVLRGRFNALPEVATVQQLQRCYEELTPLKLRMAELPEEVADAKVLELCASAEISGSRELGVGCGERTGNSCGWSGKRQKDLTKQFSSVSAMQSQMASMDGQMEIVTGLIQRTAPELQLSCPWRWTSERDTMVRFLQHIQNGMTDACACAFDALYGAMAQARLWAPCVLPGVRGAEGCEIRCAALGVGRCAVACHSGQVWLFRCAPEVEPSALTVAGWLGPEEVKALGFCAAPSSLEATAGLSGSQLLVSLLPGRLRLSDAEDGRCVAVLPLQDASATLLAVLEDGRHCALAGKELYLMDLWSGRQTALGGACERLAAPSRPGERFRRALRLAALNTWELKLWRREATSLILLLGDVAAYKPPTFVQPQEERALMVRRDPRGPCDQGEGSRKDQSGGRRILDTLGFGKIEAMILSLNAGGTIAGARWASNMSYQGFSEMQAPSYCKKVGLTVAFSYSEWVIHLVVAPETSDFSMSGTMTIARSDAEEAVALSFEEDVLLLVLRDRVLIWKGEDMPVQISRAHGAPLDLLGGLVVPSAAEAAAPRKPRRRGAPRARSASPRAGIEGSEPRVLLWTTSGDALSCSLDKERAERCGRFPAGRPGGNGHGLIAGCLMAPGRARVSCRARVLESLLAASGLCGALALRSGVLLAWHEGTWTLAAWAHLACALSDPGAVPRGAAEALAPEELGDVRWCKHCQVAKPPRAHHCSTCQRCIRKMDHHCMWMNNCIGANNQKHFLLFLIYTSAHCLGVPLGVVCLLLRADEESPWYHVAHICGVAGLLLAGCVGRFCVQLLMEQLRHLSANQTGIELLQGTTGESRSFRATLQEVMGSAPSLRWLLPLPEPRGESAA